MYALAIDGRLYDADPTDPTRTPFTLVSALRAARGCANARVYRDDRDGNWSAVVTNAGSDVGPLVHVGRRGTRTVNRRLTRQARRRYEAEMDARNADNLARWRAERASLVARGLVAS